MAFTTFVLYITRIVIARRYLNVLFELVGNKKMSKWDSYYFKIVKL